MTSKDIIDQLRQNRNQSRTILMFSGGRDSTLSLHKMLGNGEQITLVTVTSGHLLGIDLVRQRLKEVEQHLTQPIDWVVIKQPNDLISAPMLFQKTCLPCHHAYTSIGAAVCKKLGANRLAYGYVKYQSTWPEQTPVAINALKSVLGLYGIHLALPVKDLSSKSVAEQQLRDYGYSPNALEQKCIQQINNVELDPEMLSKQVRLWKDQLHNTLKNITNFQIDICEHALIKPRKQD